MFLISLLFIVSLELLIILMQTIMNAIPGIIGLPPKLGDASNYCEEVSFLWHLYDYKLVPKNSVYFYLEKAGPEVVYFALKSSRTNNV